MNAFGHRIGFAGPCQRRGAHKTQGVRSIAFHEAPSDERADPAETMTRLSTVLVTGATGFVAGHIIADLLRKGFLVHGTVRDLGDETKSAFLRELSAGNGDRLALFEADLDAEDAFSGQEYFPEAVGRQTFYRPTARGEEEALAHYGLTIEEYESWRRLLLEHGLKGLRATRIQDYR